MASTDITLTTPIMAHGESQSVLSLRPITGRDLRVIGDPRTYQIDSKGQTLVIDTEIMAQLVSTLAGVPVSSVDQLTPPDWDAAMTAIMGFFAPGAAAPA